MKATLGGAEASKASQVGEASEPTCTCSYSYMCTCSYMHWELWELTDRGGRITNEGYVTACGLQDVLVLRQATEFGGGIAD